ncbi:MAG: hypothetical protein K1X88_32700 [Nannocystaceae bacterium]|nr:hypothetical protein [Nannocystaceae bacterium]
MADERDPSDEQDRAAILARRQRFVALAIGSLAATSACGDIGPKPCLNVPASDHGGQPKPDAKPDAKPDPVPTDTGAPRPCLEVVPDDVRPQACLKIAQPPPETPPQPCLKVAPPPPETPPRPCLKVAPPPETPATPTPCLSVPAKPKPP